MVDELAVEHGVDADHVLVDLGLDPVRDVVVDRVLHVLRQDVLEPLLVQLVVVKYLHQHIQEPLGFIRVEPYLQHFLPFVFTVFRRYLMHILVLKDVIEYLLHHCQSRLEYDIRELGTTEHSSLHVLERDVLEPEHLLRVVVRDQRPVHPPDLALHNVLEEPATDQVVVLPFIRGMLPFVLDYFVVQVVDVVGHVVPDHRGGSRLQLEHHVLALRRLSAAVDLRPQEQFAALHIPEVIFFVGLVLDEQWLLRLVGPGVEHIVVGEELVVSGQHLLHVLAHLEQHHVRRLDEARVPVDRVQLPLFVHQRQVHRVGFPLRYHELEGLSIECLAQIVEMRALEVAQAVVNVRQHRCDSARAHYVLAVVLERLPYELWVLSRRMIRGYAFFVDLRVLRQIREERTQFALVEVVDRFHRVDARVLKHHVQSVLQRRDLFGVLPVVLHRGHVVVVDVELLTHSLPVQVKVVQGHVVVLFRLGQPGALSEMTLVVIVGLDHTFHLIGVIRTLERVVSADCHVLVLVGDALSQFLRGLARNLMQHVLPELLLDLLIKCGLAPVLLHRIPVLLSLLPVLSV